LQLLSPLLAQELSDLIRYRRKLLAAARALLAGRMKALLTREPIAVVLVTPATEEIPIDEADVAKRLDDQLTKLAERLKQLRAKLKAGDLSAFSAQISVITDAPHAIVQTGAQLVRLGERGSKPDQSLAQLLLARWTDGASLPFTVWSLGVKRADLNLQA